MTVISESDFVFPRELTRQRRIWGWVSAVFFFFAVLSLLFTGYAYGKSALPWSLLTSVSCLATGFVTCLRSDSLSRQLRLTYLNCAPAGIYFTGDLYRSTSRVVLPGGSPTMRAYITTVSSRFSKAIGCNGVIQEPSGDAWFALLLVLDGEVRAIPKMPAEFGWQAWIKYRC